MSLSAVLAVMLLAFLGATMASAQNQWELIQELSSLGASIGAASMETPVKTEMANGVKWYYVPYDNVVHVVAAEPSGGIHEIPSALGGKSVTEINANRMYYENPGIQRVVIPDGVQSMGLGSWFGGCTALESVVLGNGIREIPEQAFIACSSLTNVVLGNQIETIRNDAFMGCEQLREIVIPDSVKKIQGLVFGNCTNLTNISLGSGLEWIGPGALLVPGVRNLTIPASVRYISYAAFDDNLEDVWFLGPPPDGPKSVLDGDDLPVFENLRFFARGHYTKAHAGEWKAVIDKKGMWKELRMFGDGDHPVLRPLQPWLTPERVDIPPARRLPAMERLALFTKLSPRFPAELRKAADKGDVSAIINIATAYYFGRGVDKDLSQALGWFHRAADQGDVRAQYNLGLMLQNGEGVSPRDAEDALGRGVFWTRLAAEEGEPQAQRSLGLLYLTGKGVSQDVELGKLWIRVAAEQGDNIALKVQEALAQATEETKGGIIRLHRNAWSRDSSESETVDISFVFGKTLVLPENPFPGVGRKLFGWAQGFPGEAPVFRWDMDECVRGELTLAEQDVELARKQWGVEDEDGKPVLHFYGEWMTDVSVRFFTVDDASYDRNSPRPADHYPLLPADLANHAFFRFAMEERDVWHRTGETVELPPGQHQLQCRGDAALDDIVETWQVAGYPPVLQTVDIPCKHNEEMSLVAPSSHDLEATLELDVQLIPRGGTWGYAKLAWKGEATEAQRRACPQFPAFDGGKVTVRIMADLPNNKRWGWNQPPYLALEADAVLPLAPGKYMARVEYTEQTGEGMFKTPFWLPEGGGTDFEFEVSEGTVTDVTLVLRPFGSQKPCWRVSFDGNGGVVDFADVWCLDGSWRGGNPQWLGEGRGWGRALPVAKRTGDWTFEGWTTVDGEKIDGLLALDQRMQTDPGNIVLKAKWKATGKSSP